VTRRSSESAFIGQESRLSARVCRRGRAALEAYPQTCEKRGTYWRGERSAGTRQSFLSASLPP
jgi:hypothetical protein